MTLPYSEISTLCECGCGEPAPIATQTDTAQGYVKGQPRRFKKGHHTRLAPQPWAEEDRGHETPCHVWKWAKDNDGYGRVTRDGGSRLAHRIFWEQANGPVPHGLELDHLCRQRDCVNPLHMEAVPHSENMRRGAVAKLTRAEADEIRGVQGRRHPLELAAEYGVSKDAIYDIWAGRTWR